MHGILLVGMSVPHYKQIWHSMHSLEQALWSCQETKGFIHHSDMGSQYLSIRYSKRLAEAKIDASVGSVGDTYDNALAETISDL